MNSGSKYNRQRRHGHDHHRRYIGSTSRASSSSVLIILSLLVRESESWTSYSHSSSTRLENYSNTFRRPTVSPSSIEIFGISSVSCSKLTTTSLYSSGGGNLFRKVPRGEEDDDDEEDDEDDEQDLYETFASSEFIDSNTGDEITQTSSPTASIDGNSLDWGGEYDTLRTRFDDAKSGNNGPSRALFRLMTTQTPNESIMSFISDASPQVVQAMSGAVSSLLGGLSNPGTGVETIVKANGEKLGSLCFQLQMTGYMFRNAEYVLAIRDLMNIAGSATLAEYKRAFDKLDKDGSGYIESLEIEALLSDVYADGDTPAFEIDTFLQFFDSNNDGKISWEEFERGLGVVAASKAKSRNDNSNNSKALPASLLGENDEDDDDDDDDDYLDDAFDQPNVSGTVKIEMKNGKIIEVEAKEYIDELKKEAEALKAALSREKGIVGGQQQQQQQQNPMSMPGSEMGDLSSDGIASYIASLKGDIQSLTKGISPDVVDAMKMLVDFVLDGGPSGRGKGRENDAELEMEVPGSALQQLALWQLVLGYKLREAEATGEYRKMLE